MVLKALNDYYYRNGEFPPFDMELKEIRFIIVIDQYGKFLFFEDRQKEGKKSVQQFLVKRHIVRSSAPVADCLYGNSKYVFGYSNEKDKEKTRKDFEVFKAKVEKMYDLLPDNVALKAVYAFYQQDPSIMVEAMQRDSHWSDVVKNLEKDSTQFSFLIKGDTEIVASKEELINLELNDKDKEKEEKYCLVIGEKSEIVELTTDTKIPGSQPTAKLVAFQVKSGYDSYGKSKCYNSPISVQAEFAYTTALKHLLRSDSHNKFMVGSRTFLFWSSSNSEASKEIENSLYDFLGCSEKDDPNSRIELVRQTFKSIYKGKEFPAEEDDRFFILGLAPNSARLAVVYWNELPLREFADLISRHFFDMEIIDTREKKKPYEGLYSILGSVTLGGKSSDAPPNLPDAVVKSIFQGLPYPSSLFQACIRRIRAEQNVTITRAAIIKAYLNRVNYNNNNNKKNNPMSTELDYKNQNQGYLCGRLFAVLDKIQYDANNIHSIRERYMNSASATPAMVFATILNLSTHHLEKLSYQKQVFYEQLKQEIISKLDANGFPAHLNLQDQGRFFVGYYHQQQKFFSSKKTEE